MDTENLAEAVKIRQRLIKDRWLHSLYLFNKECLQIEKGKEKVKLSAFHKELCDFVDERPDKQKLILVPRGHLKALKTEGTEILTPKGFKKYKELKVGDEVIGVNGLTTKIKVIYPKSKMQLYRVTTNDGRELICNKEHLFKVRLLQNDRKWRIRNLNWIIKRYSKERFDKRNRKIYYEHAVQLQPIPVEFKEKKLPIDPYTLGIWLGDGTSSGSAMTSADPEIFNYSNYKWHRNKVKYLYNTHGLQKILRLNNLKNNKHIPKEYSISSYKQRLELLRGLMDTDGTCHCQGGIAYFSNTNYQLIKDIVELIRSLGGVAMVCRVNMYVNNYHMTHGLFLFVFLIILIHLN
jgi:intein/homing endonuclease